MNYYELSPRVRKLGLALECVGLFAGLPAIGAAFKSPMPVIPMLLMMALGCGLVLRVHHKIRLRDLLRPRVPADEWGRMLLIYLVALVCLFSALWLIRPEAMFSLVRQHTKVWLLLMFAYPLISVFPQELIYRSFFFEHYRPLFGRGGGMILASAAFFSFGHILFHNWPSIILSFAGGCVFARTYQRTNSLFLVCVEHALYGCAAFTIGYGEFFFDSTMRLYR